MQLTPIKDLHASYLNVTSINYDWSEGYGEKWEAYAIDDCYECGNPSDISGQCETEDCKGRGEYAGGEPPSPMMNYYYPLGDFRNNLEESCLAIKDLPLVIVRFLDSDEYALALSGGGMNLQWEICEAFMRLGQLPPVHFADVPAMAGRGTSKRDRWILSGCRASVRYSRLRLASTLRSINQTAKYAREYANRKVA